jgi:drug/metabolite transporter (DMT)-like permease
LIYSIIYMTREKTITFEPKTKKIYALLIIFYFVFVYAVIQGIKLSSHAGYVHSIVNSSTALLFLIYLIYFKRELKINHVVGLLFVFGGLLILVNASVTEPKLSLKHIL